MIPRMGISWKLTVLLMSFGTFMLLTVGVLAHRAARESLRNACVSELLYAALDKEADIDRWISHTKGDLARVAESGIKPIVCQPRGPDYYEYLQAELEQQVSLEDAADLVLIDVQDGTVIASTLDGEFGEFRADRSYFQGGQNGVFVEIPSGVEDWGKPSVVLSAPVRDDTGVPIAVVAARFDLSELDELVSRRTGLRSTDDAFMVSADGRYLTQPRFIDEPVVMTRRADAPAVQRCLGHNSGFMSAPDYRGVAVLEVFRWLPKWKMGLLVKMDQTEAFAAADELARDLMTGSGVILLFGAGLATLLGRTLTRPIVALRRAAQRIAEGDLDVRVPELSRDEVGGLARDFNAMTTALSDRAAVQEYAAKMRHEKDTALAASQLKTAFLANMSHEIRTPMMAIVGYANLLLRPHQTASDWMDWVQTIIRNGRHLLSLIDDVLDVSKIEAGRMAIERIDCSPAQILMEVASLMRVRAREKGLGFEAECIGLVPRTIRTDPTRLRQILMNLLSNAVKFTDAGKVRITLELADPPESENPRVRYRVIDTGIGLSDEQIARLFQPFTQADLTTTRRFGGTGLGLNISRSLAKLMGGDVSVESRPDQGSTFTVEIETGPLAGVPMAEYTNEALMGLVDHAPCESADRIRLRGRVLIADDGVDNQRLLALFMRDAGLDVTLANDGKEALDKVIAAQEEGADGRGFDVILMDMQMPVLDGYAATSLLRSRGYEGPIIAITAHAMEEDRIKCLDAGCTDYLSKPVEEGRLLTVLASHLNQGVDVPAGPTGASEQELTSAGPAGDSASIAMASRPLVSTYAGNPRMEEILREFVAALPKQVRTITDSLDAGDLAQLRRIVHQIKGVGGGYGFAELSSRAAQAEAALKSDSTIDSIRAEIDALIELIRSVGGYAATGEAHAASADH